jgi:hypothetical protein
MANTDNKNPNTAQPVSVGLTYKNKNDGSLTIPFALERGIVAHAAPGSSRETRTPINEFQAAHDLILPKASDTDGPRPHLEPGAVSPTFDGKPVPTSPESPFHPDKNKQKQ